MKKDHIKVIGTVMEEITRFLAIDERTAEQGKMNVGVVLEVEGVHMRISNRPQSFGPNRICVLLPDGHPDASRDGFGYYDNDPEVDPFQAAQAIGRSINGESHREGMVYMLTTKKYVPVVSWTEVNRETVFGCCTVVCGNFITSLKTIEPTEEKAPDADKKA